MSKSESKDQGSHRVDTGRLFRSPEATRADAIPVAVPKSKVRSRGAAPVPAPAADDVAYAPTMFVEYDDRTMEHESVPDEFGIGGLGVWLVIIGVTVLVAFADAIAVSPGTIGWLTGAALVVATGYCAIIVRHRDRWAAVIAPPLAFLIATLTAGQFALPNRGTTVTREAIMITGALSVNVAWICGAVLLALLITGIKGLRRRSQP